MEPEPDILAEQRPRNNVSATKNSNEIVAKHKIPVATNRTTEESFNAVSSIRAACWL
jgi:hypothetical protein